MPEIPFTLSNAAEVLSRETLWVDISEHFYKKVLQGARTVLMTSAMAQSGSYREPIRALGFDRLDQSRLKCVKPIEHIFDYSNHSVLAIPTDSPGYEQEEAFLEYMADAVYKIARMLGGKTLVLFTNLKRKDGVFDKVRARLENEGIRVYKGSGSGLLEMFQKEQNAVLFGSRGYFEGIDVKGPALSCVIIDKLSFGNPEEPVLKARCDSVSNSFHQILLLETIKTLHQQFGRLIRSAEDRGFVLVMDQLKPQKSYYNKIKENMPPLQS